MPFNYAVLGAGRQGTAAAYDFVRWGDARRVILGDIQLEVAVAAAQRVNRLTGRDSAAAAHVDVTDPHSVLQALDGVDAFLSAVPYPYNLELTRLAVEAGVHMADLGGNTEIVLQQHKFNDAAREKGVSILPDCGQVPGDGHCPDGLYPVTA